MIVVKIELHSAVTGQVSQIGEMHIFNDGTSSNPSKGHYGARILRKPNFRGVTRKAEVRNYPRLNLPVWNLVQRSLNALYPKERDK